MIIAWICAAVAMLAALVTRPSPPELVVPRSLGLDPAQLTALVIEQGSRSLRVSRGGGPAGWSLEETVGRGSGRVWPADESRVRATLRLLSRAEARPLEGKRRGDDTTLTFRWTTGEQNEQAVRLGPPGPGGLATIEFGGETLLIESQLFRLLSDASLVAWGSRQAMPGAFAVPPRSIRLDAAGQSLKLTRRGERWTISTRSGVIPADSSRIGVLATALANLNLAIGVEAQAEPESRESVATLTVEAPGGTRWILDVTGPAGLDGASVSVVARIERDDGTGASYLVTGTSDRSALDAITLAPEAFAARQILDVSRARVARVVISPAQTGEGPVLPQPGLSGASVLERGISGWSGTDGELAEALFTLVLEAPAQAILVDRPRPDGEGIALIQLEGSDGVPLGAFSLRLGTDVNGETLLWARTGPVDRAFDGAAVAGLLETLAQRVSEAATPSR